MIRQGRVVLALFLVAFVGVLALQMSSYDHLVVAFSYANSIERSEMMAATVVFVNAALAALAVVNPIPRLRKYVTMAIVGLGLIEVFLNAAVASESLASNLEPAWAVFYGVPQEVMWRVAAFAVSAFAPLVSLLMVYVIAESAKPYLLQYRGDARAAQEDEQVVAFEDRRRRA